MPNILLEILTEEIPARFQVKAVQDFENAVTSRLTEAGLTFSKAESYSTPRRLAVIVHDVPTQQPDIKQERKGPKTDAPEQAINGFLKSVGIPLNQCEKRDAGKGQVYYAVIEKKGSATLDILADIINDSIKSIPWEKSMRFADYAMRFVRPVHNIVAVFGTDTVSGQLDLGGKEIQYSNETLGHRFMSSGAISVTAETYVDSLKNNAVIVDRCERQRIITESLATQSKALGINVIADEKLLQEIIGLVEYPVPLIGKINQDFMQLPKEVLVTSMREHQKFFAFTKDGADDGTLSPYFATVANIQASDGGTAIIQGNERVLKARLADSAFFWNNDLKHKLENNLAKLENVVFHAQLGSVKDRVNRMVSLSQHIIGYLDGNVADAGRASLLAKADLVSEMVFEFPELQGIMGQYYAKNQGENDAVATAIYEHYTPQGPNDTCPSAPVSVAVSIAEKLDTLTGFWLIGEKPTGSKDPFALRRCALGIIRMILENDTRLDLAQCITESAKLHKADGDITADLLQFFADRVKQYLKSKGIRHDYIGGVLSKGITDLVSQVRLAQEITNNADVVSHVKASYTRAKNITGKASHFTVGNINTALFAESQETALYDSLKSAKDTLQSTLQQEQFAQSVAVLADIRPALDDFFENVMVNAEDEAIKNNRLNLLGNIIETVNTLADFDIIEA